MPKNQHQCVKDNITDENLKTRELNVKENDDFLDHLNSIINNGDYDSSSTEEDFKSDTKNYEDIDDDGQMQTIIDLLQNNREKTAKKNKTFSEDKLRDIDRKNTILMKKIISNNRRPSQYAVSASNYQQQTSAAINRRRQQKKIDQENMVLLKKIQSIKPFGLSHHKNY